jgi:FkbM family methyltransferase
MFLSLLKNLFLNKKIIYRYLINKYKNFLVGASRKHSNMDVYLKKNLNNNIIVFDVGAHIGESVIRIKKIFPEATIHCFEPVIQSFNILKKNILYFNYKKVILNNFSLFNTVSSKYIKIHCRSDLSSFFSINKKKKQKTTTLTIDHYIKINKIKSVDFIKIDTQGSELEILRGAKKTLKSKKIKFLEIEIIFKNKLNIYRNSISFYQIEKFLNRYNFYLVKLDGLGEHKDFSSSQINALYKCEY